MDYICIDINIRGSADLRDQWKLGISQNVMNSQLGAEENSDIVLGLN